MDAMIAREAPVSEILEGRATITIAGDTDMTSNTNTCENNNNRISQELAFNLVRRGLMDYKKADLLVRSAGSKACSLRYNPRRTAYGSELLLDTGNEVFKLL